MGIGISTTTGMQTRITESPTSWTERWSVVYHGRTGPKAGQESSPMGRKGSKNEKKRRTTDRKEGRAGEEETMDYCSIGGSGTPLQVPTYKNSRLRFFTFDFLFYLRSIGRGKKSHIKVEKNNCFEICSMWDWYVALEWELHLRQKKTQSSD